MGKRDVNNLGQYFTLKKVARFMNSFIENNLTYHSSILDPCIGKNIFFQELKNNNYSITGLEIDESLITQDIRNFYKNNCGNLIIGDFIKHNFLNKFDAIIMNPPYIRQEKISFETKRELTNISNSIDVKISRKSNFYIYFILKALSLLKHNGTLVVITYDSWLYSSFGKTFRKYITDNYELKRIIHFKNNAFLNIDIGATIIIIKNVKKGSDFLYLSLQNPDELDIVDNEKLYIKLSYSDLLRFNDHLINSEKIIFDKKYFKKIADYSNKMPWRGAESPANKYFLFKADSLNGLTKIVKYGSINTYFVTERNNIFALNTPKNISDIKIAKYLDDIRKIILSNRTSTTLKKRVLNDPYWYRFQIKRGGNIIFNYYFRENIKFLFNKMRLPTMGNFYNLEIKDNIFPLIALFNSALTKYSFIRFSKNQGRGLRKIQLNEFNEVPIIKLELFTKKEVRLLHSLGKELSRALENPDQIINNINKVVLFRYSKISGQNLRLINKIILNIG